MFFHDQKSEVQRHQKFTFFLADKPDKGRFEIWKQDTAKPGDISASFKMNLFSRIDGGTL
jgi:hypothetical protein